MPRLAFTPAAAIAARKLGIVVPDDQIVNDPELERHIFHCPDCDVVDPQAVYEGGREEISSLLEVRCRRCGRLLMWQPSEDEARADPYALDPGDK
jgi:hypothetical protein